MSDKPLVLITGAAGLMGRYLVREMREAAYPVRGFDLREGTEECEWVVGNVTAADDVGQAMKGVGMVIHTAARANIWQGTGEQILQTNVMGTWQVYEAARLENVSKVVFCSSDSVVGYTVREGAMVPPSYMPVDTNHPLRATDPYALSKILGEDIARSFTHWGMTTVALRTVFVAYPEMEGEIKARHADPQNYTGTPAGGPSSAGGGAFYNYIDPRDLAQAFRLALELDLPPGSFRSYFLSAGETLSPEPTADRAKRLHGDGITVCDPDLYKRMPYAGLYDTEAAERELGFVAQHSLRHLIESNGE